MHIILPYWQDHRIRFEAAAEELGVEDVFTGENGNNALRQIDIFEQVVKEKTRGHTGISYRQRSDDRAYKRSDSQGIPVVCIDKDAPDSNRLTYFGTDNYQSGYLAADIIGKKLGGIRRRGDTHDTRAFTAWTSGRGVLRSALSEKYPE